jgi:hypothetical protein
MNAPTILENALTILRQLGLKVAVKKRNPKISKVEPEALITPRNPRPMDVVIA